jgi:serine/threonine protein kinase/tetratricopeptide (TPR) repeat protein
MVSLIGQTVSHYSILDRLGGGGMGIVYKAEDIRLRRTVALKFLPPELTRDPEAKERFIHEAQAASAFQHNNIGVVHDIDETEDGHLFIVMEYYEGETLKKKIGRGMLSMGEAADIVAQAAAGLARAHEHGIIHRDIKPANIMITLDGVVKIVDFGLAKLSGRTVLTKTGWTVGTAAYMSPEQAQCSDVDGRTDIWSLGVVLYEMIAGRRPFESDFDQALVYSIINEDPPPITGFRQGIPEHLVALCKRCLAKDKESRLQSMEEVSRLLGKAPPTGVPAARILFTERGWRRTGLFLGMAVVLVIVVASLMTFRSSAPSIPSGKVVLGIARFENQSQDTSRAGWPAFIQGRLFDNFAGRKDIAVFDPVTSNDMIERAMAILRKPRADAIEGTFSEVQVRFIIDGILSRSSGSSVIEMSIIDLTKENDRRSTSVRAANADDLANGVDTLSQWLSRFLPIEHPALPGKGDTERWHSPKVHLTPAVSAFALGSELSFRGDSLAIKYLEQAIQMEWAFIPPRAWLISKLVARGSLEEATPHFRYLENLRNTGSLFEQALIDWAGAQVKNDIQGQMRTLALLLDYSPGNNLLMYHLSRLKYMQWDFNGCVETLRPALKTNWQYSPMHYLMAEAYEQLGNFTEARRLLEQSLACEPVYPEVYALLSTLCRRDQDSSLALKYESRYIDVSTHRGTPVADSYAMIARLSMDRGQDENAGRFYALAEGARQNYAPFHQGRGEAFLYLGDTTSALGEFRRALALDPRYADPQFRLGDIFEQKGDRKLSVLFTRSYLRLDSAGTHSAEARARLVRLKR